MRFALLGIDADSLTLALFVSHDPRHQLVFACETGVAAAQIRVMAPDVQVSTEWEALLSTSTADAVIVGGTQKEDERADQLRKLVQECVPLILTHPAHPSMLICYELDMIRRETGAVLVPYIPYRWHAGLRRAGELIAASERAGLGAIEQIVMERTMNERSRPSVEAQFARDVDLLRAISGELTSISALAPGGRTAASYANLGVQLVGESGLLTRWSVGPIETAPIATLILRASAGKAVLRLPDAGQPTELEITAAGKTEREAFAAWDPAASAVAELERALQKGLYQPSWPDACRDVELADALGRSLAKGRTIELQDEEHSEHGTFKGTMTSLGCGLLLASLVVFFIAAALATITGKPIFSKAPYLILGVLGIFLALQSLKLVFREK